MTIPAQMSLSGCIAKTPQISFTSKGDARLYARIGVEHFRKEPDGGFTPLDSTFHDLVAYGKTAEHAYAQLKVGDNFVASGYVSEYEFARDGVNAVPCEEFVARRIGHDLARTTYEVQRLAARPIDAPDLSLQPPASSASEHISL